MKWFRVSGPDDPRLRSVAEAISGGGLLILPTETVYGLAANAFDPDAAARVACVKRRPEDSPFALCAASIEAAKAVAAEWPEEAQALAAAFWPGPLMIVLRKAPSVPHVVTAGRDTVGIRVPSHLIALRILELAGGAALVTSANVSGDPPPINARDAVAQVGMACAFAVDAGPCSVKEPSTVLDLTVRPAKLLRLGALPVESVRRFVQIQ